MGTPLPLTYTFRFQVRSRIRPLLQDVAGSRPTNRNASSRPEGWPLAGGAWGVPARPMGETPVPPLFAIISFRQRPPLSAGQVAQLRMELDDRAGFLLDRRINSVHDRIRFRLSESFLEHIPERLHLRLVFEVRPVGMGPDQHKYSCGAAARQFVPIVIGGPLCLHRAVINP